jgi:hypothetical protein
VERNRAVSDLAGGSADEIREAAREGTVEDAKRLLGDDEVAGVMAVVDEEEVDRQFSEEIAIMKARDHRCRPTAPRQPARGPTLEARTLAADHTWSTCVYSRPWPTRTASTWRSRAPLRRVNDESSLWGCHGVVAVAGGRVNTAEWPSMPSPKAPSTDMDGRNVQSGRVRIEKLFELIRRLLARGAPAGESLRVDTLCS